jgi:ribosomal protein S18 acetylase RimI-like enzyme
VADVRIVGAGVDRLDVLVEFWVRLHEYQSSVADRVEGIELRTAANSAEIVREIYRGWLSEGRGFAFVAELDGLPVGYVLCLFEDPHFMWDTGRMGHIDSFYVLPEARGQGVGRALMDRAYEEVRAAGVTTVALDVLANNDLARRFYEREGFTTSFVQMLRHLPGDGTSAAGR